MPYCKYCGKEVIAGTKFCSNCGAPVTAEIPSQVPLTPAMESRGLQRPIRPFGISILAFLEGLVSFFMLLAGVALIAVAAFLAAGGWDIISEEQIQRAFQEIPWAQGFTGVRIMALTTVIMTVIGIVILFIAIIGFIMTWGLWGGKKWAWTITMILSVLGLLFALFSLPGSLVSMLLHVLVLYYLTRPHVKAYYYR